MVTRKNPKTFTNTAYNTTFKFKNAAETKSMYYISTYKTT